LLDLRGDLLGLDRPAGLYRPWEEVLSQLDLLKPERPLDGIVLTISVADLSGPTKLRPEALAERGEVFNRRLGRMQRQLGMQLPI
ncbi:type VI secretion protein IcmF/TssM N-terminal domain-containing protein, partial [Acinetobacter baumannii]